MAATKEGRANRASAKRGSTAKIIRFADEDIALVNEAIRRSGMGESAWCRMILLAGAGYVEEADAILRAHKQAQKAER